MRVRQAPADATPPEIYNDRPPIRAFAPQFPPKLAADPKVPGSVMQIAYVGVAENGDVINVTLAPRPLLPRLRAVHHAGPQALEICPARASLVRGGGIFHEPGLGVAAEGNRAMR